MFAFDTEVVFGQMDLEPWPELWGRESFYADLQVVDAPRGTGSLAALYADVRYACAGDPDVVEILERWDADALIDVTQIRVPPPHRGNRYGLRLVAETLARLTVDRRCVVTIIAEPFGWQSLKQRDRAPALVALDRHWRLLGFDQGPVNAECGEHTMAMITRNYQPPEDVLLGWAH